MSFEAVSQRLHELQETNKQLKDLIERLATIKFQPGSVPLKSEEDDSVMGELKSEIQQILREQFEDFGLLKQDVADLARRRHNSDLLAEKAAFEQAVQRAENELQAHQAEYRKAVLKARASLDAAKRAEHLLLVHSAFDPKPRSNTSSPGPGPGPRRRDKRAIGLSKEEREVNASSDITLALRRTHDLMASELSRSQFAHDTLKESTAALAQLGETYSTLDTMLSSSKNLLGTLLRSQKSDTWYLETAFYVLLATIAWLVFRRFLYGPLWLFMWFPMKTFKLLIGVLTRIALIGGGGKAAASVGSVAGPQTTVVHHSATRVSRPSVAPRAPSVNVGGGGKGGPMKPMETPRGQGGETVSEQVGRIIDESQSNEQREQKAAEDSGEKTTQATGEQAETERNPKKRMWEEDIETAKEAHRVKDEL